MTTEAEKALEKLAVLQRELQGLDFSAVRVSAGLCGSALTRVNEADALVWKAVKEIQVALTEQAKRIRSGGRSLEDQRVNRRTVAWCLVCDTHDCSGQGHDQLGGVWFCDDCTRGAPCEECRGRNG